MTKDEALKKYVEEILENDRLGLGQALKFKMKDDKLVRFAVSGLVKEVYTLQEKLSEAEAYSDQREMECVLACDILRSKMEDYKTTVNHLVVKNHAAIKALEKIKDYCLGAAPRVEIDKIATEALNVISGE